MSYKKLLTIQDISCVGQCSLTVALPILSACGMETCILPSAVLSTHTAGFSGFTVRDLTDDIPAIRDHWIKEGISFDAIYTGYLGSIYQIELVKSIFTSLKKEGGIIIVDPAMADNGQLYGAFDMDYAKAMATLCGQADITVPNITEACMMTGIDYKETYDEAYIQALLEKTAALGAKAVVLTGVSYAPDRTGVAVYRDGKQTYYEHYKYPKGCHGTGDVYASAFVGALANGKTAEDSARIAADYTLKCIENTQGDPDHWYGVKFETALTDLMEMIK